MITIRGCCPDHFTSTLSNAGSFMSSTVVARRFLNIQEFHLLKLTVSVNGVGRHDSSIYYNFYYGNIYKVLEYNVVAFD